MSGFREVIYVDVNMRLVNDEEKLRRIAAQRGEREEKEREREKELKIIFSCVL